MWIDELLKLAQERGASDLHLEAGLPAAMRVRGALRIQGAAVEPAALEHLAMEWCGDEWDRFVARGSFDLSRVQCGVRCRVNIFKTSRGLGFAIRLLTATTVTLDRLNLHPELRQFLAPHQGLVLVTGATGSGKSTTVAALIEEINRTESRHIVTIESPIEYQFRPQLSYIRQREVGRDTPSFEQALLDALREDPDVLLVGEMREPETMRLTLNASETGHLVFATMHSSTCAEALQRLVTAFPAEIQGAVCGQLADCLVGVVAQRLRYRADLDLRIPECEILTATHPVRHMIRSREFFKLTHQLETGADQGMWTFSRYGRWLDARTTWNRGMSERPDSTPETAPGVEKGGLDGIRSSAAGRTSTKPAPSMPTAPRTVSKPSDAAGGRVEIVPDEGGLDGVLKRLIGS